MINQLLRATQILFIIFLVLAGAWALVMYMGWPLWAILPTALGALLLFTVSRWLYRRWKGWRLRRQLLNTPTSTKDKNIETAFEKQWQAGIKTLRDGRLGTEGRTLYGLPWLLVLDAVAPKENDELYALAVQKALNPEAEPGLSWCFLKSAIMLRFPVVTESNNKTAIYWQLLVKKLNKHRKREPLNGVVFNIDSDWLAQAPEVELHQLGSHLRHQLDTIDQVFNARIPCWIVLSQSQCMMSLHDFIEHLSPDQRAQSFGFHEEHTNSSVHDFMQKGFDQLLNRTADLSLWLGQTYPDSAHNLRLPEQIRQYEAPLLSIFAAAFEHTPYAVNPLLKGVYWTAATSTDQVVTTWFTKQLYEQTLPYQRHSWEAVDKLGPWRRVLRQAAVLSWLGLCAATALLLIYSAKDVRGVIKQVASRNTHQLNFSGGVEPDLQAINILHDTIIQLSKNTQGLSRLLPFRYHLVDLEKQLKQHFVFLYKQEIRDDFMDGLILKQLPAVIKNGEAIDIAAWAQYLVRRINLLEARLNNNNLKNLPLIGPEFTYLYAQATPQVGLQTGVLIGQLYPDYLNWQSQNSALQSELDSLKATLQQLSLGLRQIDWLLAWVDLQNDLMPITLADFWPIQIGMNEGPQIAAGLTKAGIEAIQDFVKEVATATGDNTLWLERRQKMNASFTQASYDAWYQFLSEFNQGKNYLNSESNWKSVLSLSFSANDPYIKLFNTLNTIFSEIPVQQRPEWIRTAIEIDLLLKTSEVNISSADSWVNKAQTINQLGHIGWQVLRDETSVEKSVNVIKDGVTAIDELNIYKQLVKLSAAQMLKGEGNAMTFAEQTWAYGYDATITESPLHDAQMHFSALRKQLSKEDVRENVIWRIANGPLSFALDYAARSAACGLQSQWNTQVVSIIEHVYSQRLAQDLLYGANGSLETFMSGPLHYFVDRNKNYYAPRKALGLAIPINNEFFTYLNTVQIHQTGDVVQKFEQEYKDRQYALQLTQLQQQEKELEKQASQRESSQAIVAIEMTPPLMNAGAKRLPQRTSLTLECTPKAIKLENYNFPTKQVFNWDSSSCGDTIINIQFPEWSIEKTYSGQNGFLKFLEDFQTGSKTFVAADFPTDESQLQAANIDSIHLRWQLRGQKAALSDRQQKSMINTELLQVQKAILAIQEKQAGPNLLQQPLIQAHDIIPEKIASHCWHEDAPPKAILASTTKNSQIQELALVEFETTTEAQTTAESAASKETKWIIHVGVFTDPALAVEQLNKLKVSNQTKSIVLKQQEKYLVYSSGYNSRAEAQKSADKIAKSMKLSPQVLSGH